MLHSRFFARYQMPGYQRIETSRQTPRPEIFYGTRRKNLGQRLHNIFLFRPARLGCKETRSRACRLPRRCHGEQD